MEGITIAVAQFASLKGNINENIKNHIRFIETAAGHEARFIIFPELSLTGYEPELAKELALLPENEKLAPLAKISQKHNIIIAAGAPIPSENGGINIGLVCFYPNRERKLHTKEFLHPGEEKWFVPGNKKHYVEIDDERIALAICADINHFPHAKEAADNKATIYASSVLIGDSGYEADTASLKQYASDLDMTVLMSNYCSETGGWIPAGKSAVWNTQGELLCQLQKAEESMILINKSGIKLECKVVTL